MDNYGISVIMSVYNDEKYLSIAIESILNQTYKNFEFIIINDGSTDGSINILEYYQKLDSRIIVINQENVGLTKSLNKVIKISKFQYIARMDSDDISDKFRLEKQIAFLKHNKGYALVGTNIIKIDKNGNEIEKNKTKYSYKDILNTFKTRNCIAHGSVLLNRQLLGDMLYYDENFLYAQDFKLWTKISKKYKIANLKEYLYNLRIHEVSISKNKIKEQSISAAVVSYEFEYNTSVINIEEELKTNTILKHKVGFILLLNSEPNLAIKYFDFFNIYFYISFISKYINLNKMKNLIKIFK